MVRRVGRGRGGLAER